LLQNILIQGQGWARGYAAAALVECIKVLSDGSTSSSSSTGSTSKDVSAILTAIFDVLIDEKVPSSARRAMAAAAVFSPEFFHSEFVSRATPQVSRSIGDERDCCACVNYILHSAAPLLLPSVLEAHIASLRNMVSKGRDVQAVVAWQQLAVLIQSGRVPRSSCDWFVESVSTAAAGPSSPALRMALVTALRACVIAHQLSPVPILSRFLSCTLVPEPAVDEVRRCCCIMSAFRSASSMSVCFCCVYLPTFSPQTMESFTQHVRDVSITGLPGVRRQLSH
jgi:hypothetical protein